MTLSFGPIWLLPSFLLYVPPFLFSPDSRSVTSHTFQPGPSMLSHSVLLSFHSDNPQLCQSNHLLSSLWPKSPDSTGWFQYSVVVCTHGGMCLRDSVIRCCRSLPFSAESDAHVTTVLSPLFQAYSLLEIYPLAFPPVFLLRHRSNPSSNPTCYSQMLL